MKKYTLLLLAALVVALLAGYVHACNKCSWLDQFFGTADLSQVLKQSVLQSYLLTTTALLLLATLAELRKNIINNIENVLKQL